MKKREVNWEIFDSKNYQLEMESEVQTRVPHRCLYWGPGGVEIIFIKALGWM